MRLLFITRKYPPMVGGMEKVSFALSREFKKISDTTLITWGKSQKYLPLVIPLFLIKSIILIPKNKIQHVHIGDALLSPLGLFLKVLFRRKVSVTVHGLDITFNFPGYQLIITKCVAKLDRIICVSNATRDECIKRGIPASKCEVIPWGVYPEEFKTSATRQDLESIIGEKLDKKKVIVTVGRLIRRKGVYWFIKNVFPTLKKNSIYLVIGDGPEKERIANLVKKMGLEKRVLLLGKIDDLDLKTIYNTADLFVMPNIKSGESIEGFGIVALEASAAGLQVAASEIEGIKDAVTNTKNGFLLEPKNTRKWKQTVNLLLEKPMNRQWISSWIENNFRWKIVTEKYLSLIE